MPRGREADRISDIPAIGWRDILWRVWGNITADNLSLMAAGIAFFGLLALFPGIAASMALAGLVTDPGLISQQLDSIGQLLPDQAAEIILNQARAVAGSETGGLTLTAAVSLLIALYSASRGVASLIAGLNVAYNEREKRGIVRVFLLTLVLTLFIIAGMLIGLSSTLLLPAALAMVGGGSWAETLVSLLRWPIMAAFTVGGLAVLYRFGPSRTPAKWRWITPGALVACVLWIIGSIGFAVYVRNFASYNETFGTLGGVVVLLMWLWLSAFIVLLGAEIDAEMEAQTAKDTTAGREKPMGRRGAVKADNLGEIP